MTTMICPTLHSSKTFLQDPVQIITYVMTRYFTAPKSLSAIFREDTISFAHHLAEAGRDINVLVNTSRSALQKVLARHFPTASMQLNIVKISRAEITGKAGDPEFDYALDYYVTVVIDGQVYNWNNMIRVDEKNKIVPL